MVSFSLAPHVYETYHEYLAEHPLFELEVLRDANMGSRLVRIDIATCGDCGWEWSAGPVFLDALSENIKELGEEIPRGALPADFIKAIRLTHAWNEAREAYCGGMMEIKLEG